jgi:hypothetical protein
MPQPSQHPALNELNRNLDLCLVTRFAHPRRHNGGAVVRCHVGVAAVDPGFVATGRGDACLEIVAHHLTRDAAEEGESVDVAADPVRQPLPQRASAYVRLQAPSAATKICAVRTSPVIASMTCTVCPA